VIALPLTRTKLWNPPQRNAASRLDFSIKESSGHSIFDTAHTTFLSFFVFFSSFLSFFLLVFSFFDTLP
jgi:hypothetical protein